MMLVRSMRKMLALLQGGLVKDLRFTFLDRDRPLRTFAETSPQAIAEIIRGEFRLAADNGNRTTPGVKRVP